MTRRASARRRRFSPRPDPGAVCVLVSGGVDSVVLLSSFLRRHRTVQPLYVRAGLIWEAAEIKALKRVLRALRSPRLRPLALIEVPMADLYGRHWSTTGRGTPGLLDPDETIYLPGRNVALMAKAATFCALRRIPLLVTGILNMNPFPDATPAFLRTLARALSLGLDAPIRIAAPFRRLTKAEVIRKGRKLPLGLTLSCARPRGDRHCGNCSKCAERARAFRRAGVVDPTDYANGPGVARSVSGTGTPGPVAKRARTTRLAAKNVTRVR